MSEKKDCSCASQQEKEKKVNNCATKHSKKTHKKDWFFNITFYYYDLCGCVMFHIYFKL